MQYEGDGKPEAARDAFQQAWDASTNDFEKAVAAHYLARQQGSKEDKFRWNQEALERAEATDEPGVQNLFPSLYLNLGRSFEELGKPMEARNHYMLAEERLVELPPSPYTDMIGRGISDGLKRTAD